MQRLGHWLELIQSLRNLPSEAGRHIPEDGMFTTSWPDTTAIKAASPNPFLLIYRWAPGHYTLPGRKYCFLREDDLHFLQLLSTHQPCRDFTGSDVTTRQCLSTSPLPMGGGSLTRWLEARSHGGGAGGAPARSFNKPSLSIDNCKTLCWMHGVMGWIVSLPICFSPNPSPCECDLIWK